jgi:hypothetical protein
MVVRYIVTIPCSLLQILQSIRSFARFKGSSSPGRINGALITDNYSPESPLSAAQIQDIVHQKFKRAECNVISYGVTSLYLQSATFCHLNRSGLILR